MKLTNKQKLSIQNTAQRFVALVYDTQKRSNRSDADMQFQAFGYWVSVYKLYGEDRWITLVYDNVSGTEEILET